MQIYQAHIGLTSRCNLNCKHCYRKQMMDNYYKIFKDVEMELNMFTGLLQKLKKIGLFKVVLVYGEPLLYSKLYEALNWMLKNEFDVELATNSLLLSKTKILDFERIGLSKIHISLDFPDERLDEFRGYKGLFSHVLNILDFLKHTSIRVKIVSTMLSSSYEDYEKLLFIARKYHVKSLYFIPENPDPFKTKKEQFYNILKGSLKNICRLISENDFKVSIYIHDPLYPRLCSHKKGFEPCLVGRIIHITPNGDVTICPFSQKIVSNIFKNGVKVTLNKIKSTISNYVNIQNKECIARYEKWKEFLI